MSIDPNKAESSNNSSQTFGTAFVTNIALLGIQVGAFVVLKKKLKRIYSPRSVLPPPGFKDGLAKLSWGKCVTRDVGQIAPGTTDSELFPQRHQLGA
ncbi:hypothetical protein FRC09_003650 [Ceratobasidium sp. 395]|nr:hypothetical protein FRC09_003650 [Ceratobasidium sp. 395]